jgi:hypothetical protein
MFTYYFQSLLGKLSYNHHCCKHSPNPVLNILILCIWYLDFNFGVAVFVLKRCNIQPSGLCIQTHITVLTHGKQRLIFEEWMMDILMSETCWAHKKENKIASDIKLVFHSSTITMMHGPINIKRLIWFCVSKSVSQSVSQHNDTSANEWPC